MNWNTKTFHQIVKVFLSGAITLVIAYLIHQQWGVVPSFLTAGILGILSMQPTKKATIVSSSKRVISAIVAILLSYGSFQLLGYNIYALVLMFLVFIGISWILKMPEPIAPSLVIATHVFQIDKFVGSGMNFGNDWFFLLSEFGTILLAIIIALTINLLYPDGGVKKIKRQIQEMDLSMSELITSLSHKMTIIPNQEHSFEKLDQMKTNLHQLLEEARRNEENQLFKDDHFLEYIKMRNRQVRVLYRINAKINLLTNQYEQTRWISDYLASLSQNIGVENHATPYLKMIDSLNEKMKDSRLPSTREEFENRATMFVMLNEVESFLKLKQNYHDKYPPLAIKKH